jgi:protein involved in polysaccharide export with SLBB domain
MKIARKTLAALWIILSVQQFSVVLMAQVPDSPFGTEQKPNGTPLLTSFPSNESSENSIDSLQYYVGSGDVFLVSILTMSNRQFKAVVDDNGGIVLSDYGLIKLGKVPLQTAKSLIRDHVSRKIKLKSDICVSLIKAKEVTVSVTGAIANPGTIKISGKMRLLDAIKLSNNTVLPSINELDFRSVSVTSGDSIKKIDLLQFILKGNTQQNPYVYPGDNIQINLATSRVFIGGALRNITQGPIPIREYEHAIDFISLFQLDASADSSKIIMKRGRDLNSQTVTVFDKKAAAEIILCDNDIIIIPPKENYSQQLLVSVSGEVLAPGIYPILKERTTLDEVIQMAGGLTASANKERIVIIRRNKTIRRPQQYNQTAASPEQSSVRPEINSAIVKAGLANDFAIIAAGSARDKIYLDRNDEIIIPKTERYIYISGNVERPGAYEYVKGKDLRYYVEKAGGFTPKADKVNSFVISSFNDVYQIKHFTAISEGDVIVIPDSQEAKRFVTIVLPVFQAIVTTISVVLALYATYASTRK